MFVYFVLLSFFNNFGFSIFFEYWFWFFIVWIECFEYEIFIVSVKKMSEIMIGMRKYIRVIIRV